MDKFFESNPGFRSRIAHHIDFPDYDDEELVQIADRMLVTMQYQLSEGAKTALSEYISLRRQRPNFSNARSIRNALDRCRLRQAKRLFDGRKESITRDDLATIKEEDLRASRVFFGGVDQNEGNQT